MMAMKKLMFWSLLGIRIMPRRMEIICVRLPVILQDLVCCFLFALLSCLLVELMDKILFVFYVLLGVGTIVIGVGDGWNRTKLECLVTDPNKHILEISEFTKNGVEAILTQFTSLTCGKLALLVLRPSGVVYVPQNKILQIS